MKKFFLKPINLYLFAVILGIISAMYGGENMHQFALFLSNLFMRMFKALGGPIISVALITTLSSFKQAEISTIGKKTILYTISTTIIAAFISMILYLLVQPQPENVINQNLTNQAAQSVTYADHLANIIPTNFFSPFIDNQVLSILFLSILLGVAIRFIPNENNRQIVMQFFQGLQSILFTLTRWLIAILPIGIFAFVNVSIAEYLNGANLQSLGLYFTIIILANLIQGLLVLPVWLKLNGIKPFDSMLKMLPALSLAFFSKSSSATLPVTMETAEKRLGLDGKISRLVLPLCTTLNMNGCAAFIFTTVIFVMQSNHIAVSISTMFVWIFIAVIAALGNAGVPMGCFFLSTSLLTSMNVPVELLGLILPFYNLIDMVETTLNVWSDSCIANVVNKKILAIEA